MHSMDCLLWMSPNFVFSWHACCKSLEAGWVGWGSRRLFRWDWDSWGPVEMRLSVDDIIWRRSIQPPLYAARKSCCNESASQLCWLSDWLLSQAEVCTCDVTTYYAYYYDSIAISNQLFQSFIVNILTPPNPAHKYGNGSGRMYLNFYF